MSIYLNIYTINVLLGGEEVLAHRKLIQDLSDETSTQLKHNVYQNYSQFIETAKEISHLESDMYR
jgi:hypothetical protein